jgi:hypothetical protein
MRPFPFSFRFLSCLALLAAPPRAQLILSEALADPSAVPDAQGEFLELANAGAAGLRADTLLLIVDGDSLRVAGGVIAPGEYLLLCRDSSRAADGGLPCDRQVGGLSLPNTRSIAVTLMAAGARRDFTVPPARPGVSWENTFEESQGFGRFEQSGLASADGDSATPGYRNSRSRSPAQRDLALVSLAADAAGRLTARVKSLGSETPAQVSFAMTEDGDWDGAPDGPADSAALPWPGGGEASFRLPWSGGGSIVQVTLGRDENPANDAARVVALRKGTLEISELCPAPDRGPEWAEIHNATAEGGGAGSVLSLAQIDIGGKPLGKVPGLPGLLRPGDYAVLTEDSAAFRARFGPLKVLVVPVPGWRTLRNTGDTVRIGVAGFPVDALAYSGKDAEGGCVMRGASPAGTGVDPSSAPPPAPAAPEASGPTPGFAAAPETGLGWELSGRVLAPGAALEVTVRIPSPGSYGLRVFDFEGNCVRDLGQGGPGRHVHQWLGEGRAGRLPAGPYILCLSAEGYRARRQTVVLEP